MTVYKVEALGEWVKDVEDRAGLVVADATQDMMAGIQRDCPRDTGFLVNSLLSEPGGQGEFSYVATVAGFEFGNVMEFTYGAEYAMRLEHGFVGQDSAGRNYNQQGQFWVQNGVNKWQQYIDRSAQRLAS